MNLSHLHCQKLVSHFVKGNINWGREYKIAQKLLASHSLDVLLDVEAPKLFSLSWFLTKEGKTRILEAEQNFSNG